MPSRDRDAATLVVDGPAGASLTANGKPIGFFPLDGPLELPPGTYELLSEMPGYITFETTVVLHWETDWQHVTWMAADAYSMITCFS